MPGGRFSLLNKGAFGPGLFRPSSGAPTARSTLSEPVPAVVNPLLIFACRMLREACCPREAAQKSSFGEFRGQVLPRALEW